MGIFFLQEYYLSSNTLYRGSDTCFHPVFEMEFVVSKKDNTSAVPVRPKAPKTQTKLGEEVFIHIGWVAKQVCQSVSDSFGHGKDSPHAYDISDVGERYWYLETVPGFLAKIHRISTRLAKP